MLLSGLMSRWRMSLVKLIPCTHFMLDLMLGALLIAAPFIFGFSDDGGATRFFVIAGVLELLTAMTTNWDLREEVAPPRTGVAATRS